MRHLRLLLTILALLLGSQRLLLAATRTFSGTGTWSTAGNWDTAPSDGDCWLDRCVSYGSYTSVGGTGPIYSRRCRFGGNLDTVPTSY